MADKVNVRIQEQWKPHATHPTISGYLVYAWIGHPLLGQVRGTERRFEKKSAAQKYAKGLRQLIKA